MDPDGVDVFPIENGNFPASYVNLPEGILKDLKAFWIDLQSWTLAFSLVGICLWTNKYSHGYHAI